MSTLQIKTLTDVVEFSTKSWMWRPSSPETTVSQCLTLLIVASSESRMGIHSTSSKFARSGSKSRFETLSRELCGFKIRRYLFKQSTSSLVMSLRSIWSATHPQASDVQMRSILAYCGSSETISAKFWINGRFSFEIVNLSL
jgi:hypothetical protein